MNKTTLAAALIVGLSGLIGATPFILDSQTIDFHNEEFNSSVAVLDQTGNNTSLGINSDPTLDFGYIPQGSNVTKFLNMSAKKKSVLSIKSDGNISNFLEHKDHMYFQGYKQIPLEFKGREPGNYTGNITLRFEIPENQVGKHWLDLKYWFYTIR